VRGWVSPVSRGLIEIQMWGQVKPVSRVEFRGR